MDAVPLVTTKLYTPLRRPGLVERPHLFRQLDEGLRQGVRLVLVSAPAGYGKTTLLSNWLRETDVVSAWISLDEGDNDPVRFLQYVAAALGTIVPAMQSAPAGLQGIRPAPSGALINLLINDIAQQTTPFILVLDDFHAIHNSVVLEMLTYLLDHGPRQMLLVLVSRTDPAVPLSRLRARNQLIDIRADDLRFTPEEVADFLNTGMGLRLSADDVTAMEARTEGWIAGLQLAALAMQDSEDVHAFVSAFTGSHHYIMDYLVDEVLKRQPERVRQFLLRSSILGRMCGPLCEAVVRVDAEDAVDGQAILQTLDQMNLFVVPLDGERRWYRYHHLFADVLNRHLEHYHPTLVPELHRRAAQWYEQNGFIAETTHHALAAGDQEHAARLVEQNGCQLIMRGEVLTLLKSVEAVEPYARLWPWLGVQYAWALALTGHLDRVESTLQTAERLIVSLEPTFELRILRGTVAAARAYRANMQGETHLAADFARQALDCLPDSEPFSCSIRSAATSLLGDASWMSGELEEASRAYAEAVEIGRAAGSTPMAIIASSNLAGVLTEIGHLHQAARIYSETEVVINRSEGPNSPLVGPICAGLCRLNHEWNRLEPAAHYAHKCIELGRQWADPDLLAVGYVTAARGEHARAHPSQAQEAMRAAEEVAVEHSLSPRRAMWLQAALVRWWIMQGNLERASHVVQHSGISADDDISYLREPEYLTLLRVFLAQGDYAAALSLSNRLLRSAETARRKGRAIELLILQSLAFQGNKDLAQALASLDQALLLAQPEGYVRVFLDEGEPMAKLLYQARSRRVGAGYAAELLSAMGGASGVELPPTQLLIEPLTQREIEVLKLIEAGASNDDIAAQLVISVATVKRHISNIYGKLGVQSRTQAILRAREVKLLS